ncbi:Secreted RxLR effector peptide protein [Phytophthora palmivora]|uniref:RxLR effector protein n=1 Tax=Phytophthora palmivora TaxID=4796 RepID=A0A2P4X2P1_9STRA|nr:Secreted RxLR effector peptide protein [Phytophthora palmivora]
MVMYRFLLVTLATLLVGTTALVVTKETKLLLLDHDAVSTRDDTNQGRSLRLAETFDGKEGVNGGEHSMVAGERTNPLSSVLSKISDKVPLWMKTAWWLEQRKPAEYV